MANNFNTFAASQATALSNDLDGDGAIDPGEIVTTSVTITNEGTSDATGVSFTETLDHMTPVGGTITVTPIAFNDTYSTIVGVAINVGASAGVLANDIDPDASTPLSNAGLSAIDVDNTGTHGSAVLNTDGSFTFTPEPSFAGTTSFKYTAHDAGGLNSNVAGTVTVNVNYNVALLASPDGVEALAADTVSGTVETHLALAQLDAVVDAAIARWEATGLTAAQDAYLHHVTFTVADMSGLVLGSATPGLITLDSDAAGYGWYLDATPRDDAEFAHALAVTRLLTDPSQAPAGHIDLLTTVMHELGHELGLGDRYALADRDSLMYGTLATGERRLPGEHQANGAVSGDIGHEEFVFLPDVSVIIGTLPVDKSVTISWQATIDGQTNRFIADPSNQGAISAVGPFPPVTLTDGDPGTADAQATITQLDTLTLGGTIFNDANGNGVFNAPSNLLNPGVEVGVDGVTVELYADNGNNVYDAGDTPVPGGTTTTGGGGNYSFVGLAPGDYIVVIAQSNFDSPGGALKNLQLSSPGFPGPNDNVDNDDNGARGTSGGGGDPAYTKAITLAYNTEPTNGVGNDTNTTLDLGFVASAIDPPPDVSSIVRADPNPTNAGTVHYTVTFSEAVTGVDATDFVLATSGVSGASITGVTGSGTTYTVTVNDGSGDGTVGLNFVDDDTVVDAAGNPTGGPGVNSGVTGPVYTIDKTAPGISAIVRADANPTNAATVHYTVTFSEAVTGVDATDFALATGGVSGASVTGVTGSGTTYTVTVNEGSGDGTVGLNFVDDDTVVDIAGSPTGGPGANGGFTGQTYTVDKTAPDVSSIVRADPNPTNAGTVHYTVTFSEAVTGVDATDFVLATSGVSGASITGVTGSGTTYTVTVNEGSGDGTIGLNFVDDDTVVDTAGAPTGGPGANSGVTGPFYTIDKTAPVNVAPVNTVPGTQELEANTNAAIVGLSVADVDAGSGTILTSLSVGHGTLRVASAGGAAVSGSGSGTVTLTGTLAQINTSLVAANNVVYHGAHDFFGVDTLTMATNDGGNTGSGGALGDTDTVTIHLNTHLIGTPGNDSFTALLGNERIDAGAGIDTITFGFRLVDATITYSGNEVIIDSASSHTVLTGFETYVFTDGTVNNSDSDPLVDDLFYYSQYHDVWNARADADTHYHTFGWHEGRDPDTFFSTLIYLSTNPDVKAAGVDPLLHYDQFGWKEGRTPSLAFSGNAYLSANADVAAAHLDPLAHFLAFGTQEDRQPIAPTELIAANGFDFVYYMQHNLDVAAAHVDPFQHFETIGWKEGRNPNALFDTNGYLSAYPDMAAAHVNPLDHYDQSGWHEGRDPSAGFDTTDYLAAYPDVAAAHIDPLKHFLTYGLHEGRSPFADGHFG